LSFRNPFAPRRPGGPADRGSLIKGWVREFAGFGDEVTIAVTEIDCRHSACGGVETLAMIDVTAADLRVLRFQKPLAEVSADDVRAAIEATGRPAPK
jgi:hypothetical protein